LSSPSYLWHFLECKIRGKASHVVQENDLQVPETTETDHASPYYTF
jgi:hypothetical protein